MKEEIKNLKTENETIKTNTERMDNNLNAIAISEVKTNLDPKQIEKTIMPEDIEILTSIQNDNKNFRPVEAIKNEVNQNNSEIEKKINIFVENDLLKEYTLNDGSKAVALSECAEQIVNENKPHEWVQTL